MTYLEATPPGQTVGLSWALGERLLVSTGTTPVCRLDDRPTLPAPYLTLFLAAHPLFNAAQAPYDASNDYIALITRCIDSLQAAAPDDPLLAPTRSAKLVWHFVHAIYLAAASASDAPATNDCHVSHYLSNWYADNCIDPHELDRVLALARADPDPNGSSALWDAVTLLLLNADLVSALHLLTAHINRFHSADQWATAVSTVHDYPRPNHPLSSSSSSAAAAASGSNQYSSPVILFEAVLSRAPKHTLSSRSDNSWYDWQRQCAQWCQHPVLVDCAPASNLLRAIAGHPADLAAVCTTWEQMFVACAAYMSDRAPQPDGGNLHGGSAFVADVCAAASNYFPSPLSACDGALVEAALGNLPAAIVRLEANAPSSWFAAHLCDLLVRASQLNDSLALQWHVDGSQIGMREFYLKEYARGLERYPGCWRIAVDYITACPTHGPSMLVDMFARLPVAGMSDPIVEKTLLICEKKKMKRTHSAICEKVAALCLYKNNLGGALTWYLRAHLPKQVNNVAQIALQRAQRQGLGSPGARDLECVVTALTSFEDNQMRSDLSYTTFYLEMLDARAQIASARNAGDRMALRDTAVDYIESVRNLVRGDALPRKYWCVVVFETAKVLELYPEMLKEVSRQALLELMGALELASGPNRPKDLTKNLEERLAYEARAAANGDVQSSDVRLPVKVNDALEHCRNVFVNCIAAKLA